MTHVFRDKVKSAYRKCRARATLPQKWILVSKVHLSNGGITSRHNKWRVVGFGGLHYRINAWMKEHGVLMLALEMFLEDVTLPSLNNQCPKMFVFFSRPTKR